MPYARNGSVSLYYETFGSEEDPVLLLVNGLGSQCINYRVEWCEMFAAEGFRVARFDNRDVGLSTSFDDFAPDVAGFIAALRERRRPEVPYTLSDMAADAFAVLDAVGAERAHVMGLSMGGMIVQTMAIERSERLLSMTSVMSTTGDADVGQAAPEANALLMGPPPTDRAGYIERQKAGLRIWGSPACYDEERIAGLAAESFDRRFSPAGQARQLMAIMASPSRTEALGRVRVPTLVIHGDADRLVDPSGGRRTAEAVPGARLVIFEGMGHDYPPAYWERWVSEVTGHARAATA